MSAGALNLVSAWPPKKIDSVLENRVEKSWELGDTSFFSSFSSIIGCSDVDLVLFACRRSILLLIQCTRKPWITRPKNETKKKLSESLHMHVISSK